VPQDSTQFLQSLSCRLIKDLVDTPGMGIEENERDILQVSVFLVLSLPT
jgi:hypothetical protein